MINYPIIKSEVHDNGYVVHKMVDGVLRLYSDVRAGISWPSRKNPAYFCVVAEEYLGIFKNPENPENRGKLHLIQEQEMSGLSVDRMCRALYDAATLYTIREFYADLHDDYAEYYDAIRDYGYNREMSGLLIVDAPFKGNFAAGLAMVYDWRRENLLEIDETTLAHAQTKGMTQTLLDQPDVDLINHAANALRFAVSGFYRFRPNCYQRKGAWRRKNRKGMVV